MKINFQKQKGCVLISLIMIASAFQNVLAAPPDKVILDLCNELNTATIARNYQRAVDLTYPKLVAQVGKEKLIGMLNDTVTGHPNFRLIGIECQAPTQHGKVGDLEFALLPITTISAVKNGTFKHPGSYLAISNERKTSWTFLNIGPGTTTSQLAPWFPMGIGGIVFPGKQRGLFIPADPSQKPIPWSE